MGALPKKKPSRTHTHRRKTAWYASVPVPTLTKCPNCGAYTLMHRVCKECGYYKGRQVIEAKTKIRRVSK